jgi:hypothetical protein
MFEGGRLFMLGLKKHSPCDFTDYGLYIILSRYSSVKAEAYYYRLPVPRVGDPAGATLRRTGSTV